MSNSEFFIEGKKFLLIDSWSNRQEIDFLRYISKNEFVLTQKVGGNGNIQDLAENRELILNILSFVVLSDGQLRYDSTQRLQNYDDLLDLDVDESLDVFDKAMKIFLSGEKKSTSTFSAFLSELTMITKEMRGINIKMEKATESIKKNKKSLTKSMSN